MNLKECDPEAYEELQDLLEQIIEFLGDNGLAACASGDNGIATERGYRILINPENRRIYAYKYTCVTSTKYYNYSLANPECFDKIVYAIKNDI